MQKLLITFFLFFFQSAFGARVDPALQDVLQRLRDGGSTADLACGGEHTDETGQHWFDVIVEKDADTTGCTEVYSGVDAEMASSGVESDPTARNMRSQLGSTCFMSFSFRDADVAAVLRFISTCGGDCELSFDSEMHIPDNEVPTDLSSLGESAVGANQEEVTWGLAKMEDVTQETRRTVGDYNFDRDFASGLGVRIYVLDTGFSNEWRDTDEFSNMNAGGASSRVEAGISFIPGEAVNDLDGHGTHCAGSAAGNSFGVAAGATIIPVKVLGDSGTGSTSGIIEGMEWAENDCAGRLCVLSMSLGGGASRSLDRAANEITLDGIPVVVAAGNDGADASSFSPARAEHAITVGNVDKDLELARSSNFGALIDIFAPGTNVLSASANGDTAVLTGTSMACPHVAGLVAEMIGVEGRLSVDTILDNLNGAYGVHDVIGDTKGSVNLFAHIPEDSAAPVAPVTPDTPAVVTATPSMVPSPMPITSAPPTGSVTFSRMSGKGWCQDAAGNEGTARYFLTSTSRSSAANACRNDVNCAGFAHSPGSSQAVVYSSTGCTTHCTNLAWVNNPMLITQAGVRGRSSAGWRDADCFRRDVGTASTVSQLLESLSLITVAENGMLNVFAVIGFISTVAFIYRSSNCFGKTYTEIADIEEDH